MVLFHVSLTVLILLLGLACVALNVISLPGNWFMFIAAIGLAWTCGWPAASIVVLLIILGILATAEVLELLSTLLGAKKFGASRSATWSALFGGILGAIVGSMIFPLVASLLGAIAGSFLGTLICELINQKTMSKSLWAALGAALGRTAGMIAKISCGLTAWILLVFTTWAWWP